MAMQRLGMVVKSLRHSLPPKPSPASGRPRPYEPPPGQTVLRYCAFCGCAETATWQLVAGRAAHICGGCILRACEAMADSENPVPTDRLREYLATWERVGAWLLGQQR